MSEISIIIPIYNSEKYIVKCLDSILTQDCQDFELLLINDGGTDNSVNIINSYKDKRIRIYNQENKGAGSARNLGLKYAIGKYIFFIDSDDFILQNYLSVMLKFMKEYDADIVACQYKNKNTTEKVEILDKEQAFKYLIALPEKIPMSVIR